MYGVTGYKIETSCFRISSSSRPKNSCSPHNRRGFQWRVYILVAAGSTFHAWEQECFVSRDQFFLKPQNEINGPPSKVKFKPFERTSGINSIKMAVFLYWKKTSLEKFIRNYIRDSSCAFSISSLVRILTTSFPAFSRLFEQTVSEKWRKIAKKKVTRWLEDTNFIFSF